MPFRKRKESRSSQRMARGATRKRASAKKRLSPGSVVFLSLCALTGVVLALILGNILKARSDAFRDRSARENWTVDPSPSVSSPRALPDGSSLEIRPEGNVGDILIEGRHKGVVLPLCNEDGLCLYASQVAQAGGQPVSPDAPSLAEDIARVHRRGLRVTLVFSVTCLSLPDRAQATLRRGLELALLREGAEALPDDILLLGLPSGSDESDRLALDFLEELNALLAELTAPPAIGAALPPVSFTNDSLTKGDGFASASSPSEDHDPNRSLYAGRLTPGRFLSACDYLAMDLRQMSAVGLSTILPDLAYPYGRYPLVLLINSKDTEASAQAQRHGFLRAFEMQPPSPKVSTDSEESQT